jgi:hypothetical protein
VNEIWLAFRYCEHEDGQPAPAEFLGAFTTEQLAVTRCTLPTHWIGPAPLDVNLSDTLEPWPRAYYPNAVQPEVE